MENAKTISRRTGNLCSDTSSASIGGEVENGAYDGACLENVGSEYYFNEIKSMDTTTEEDDEQVPNGGDTSTSFSLQECMNEFRSRRIRKSSLSQNRQESENRKCTNSTVVDATEQDIINQNLCNKEQERKCKPCQNGFCYCFTSDSCDGEGSLANCVATRTANSRNLRRSRHPNNDHISNNIRNKNLSKLNEFNKNIPQRSKFFEKAESTSNGSRRKNQIVAISRLETSTKDEPLVHIIQELRNNCVISEVRVNKDSLSSKIKERAHSGFLKSVPKNTLKTNGSDYSKHFNCSSQENSKPSAPTLEQILECKYPQKSEKNDQQLDNRIQCRDRRHNAGGLLLKKRISHLDLNYKPSNSKNPPPKPPRNSLGSDDKYTRSTLSTSSSVKEAEKVVDGFLAKRGFLTNVGFSKTDTKFAGRSNVSNGNDKRKSYPTSPKHKIKPAKNFLRAHASLSDIENSIAVVSKKDIDYGKNIHSLVESKAYTLRSDWNKYKINHMLNYDKTTKSKTFHSAATQAEPQQSKSHKEEVVLENPIGWQIPPKLNLDTVDGFECHNLASNLKDKSTPTKKKLTPKLKSSRTQKFLWSEQLRQISPWSNKKNKENKKIKPISSSTPKEFIKFSKKKLLRFVSPKKVNKDSINVEIRKTPFRNIGVQTSFDDISHCRSTNNGYENSSSPQSPPDSYHSPVQSISSTQSQDTTTKSKESISNCFDFSRIVHSPPKKAPRSSHRKLNFAHKEMEIKSDDFESIFAPAKGKKTYLSFNKDFNQNVSISKISHILNNIRTKLEESDKQTVRTFLNTEFDVEHFESGYDCPDGHRTIQDALQVETHPSKNIQRSERETHLIDPIYSEIEDKSIHVIESPNFDNRTGVLHFKNVDYPEVLYAKVNKYPKPVKEFAEFPLQNQSQLPLAKIIHDSLKNKKNLTNIIPLPSVPEPTESDTFSYSLPTSFTKPLTHCQSLNNVRVMEHNTIPNQQLYMSKSDVSLHRSDIFLENLCTSELVVNSKKEQNSKTNCPYILMPEPTPSDDSSKLVERKKELQPPDNVSYEMPNDNDISFDDIVSSASNLGLKTIEPSSCNNQSTPKKQSFVTKDDSSINEINVNVVSMNNSGNIYKSCSNISSKLHDISSIDKYHSCSFNETPVFDTPNILSSRYKIFKHALRKSFKKGKEMIKNERKRFFTSLNLSSSNPLIHQTLYGSTYSDLNSNLNLEELFSLKEGASLCDQIVHTVSVCRKLPDVKRSSEMVEAERLLLFSTLRHKNNDALITSALSTQNFNQLPKIKFIVDEMILPIHAGSNEDIYFNYFYIVTFQHGGVIKSTQSAEYENGAAIFRDCAIEFAPSLYLEPMTESKSICQNTIRCKVFMLRLRKISSPLIEPKNQTIIKTLKNVSSSSIKSISTSSSLSSVNEVVSRFRLQGSFNVDANNFKPYEYVYQKSHNSDQICLRASRFCNIPITSAKKSSNLAQEIHLKGRAEVRFPKSIYKGFLNVRDLTLKHSWNRRWCILDGIYFYVWHDENTLNENPLIILDLRDTIKYLNYPLSNASREECARSRSFCLELVIRKECESSSRATVFFSAESQQDLNDWLKNINNVLHFIKSWLC